MNTVFIANGVDQSEGYNAGYKAAVDDIAAKESVKTPKQIISSYHRPVCKKCQCEMRPETNGVGLLDLCGFGPYQVFDADLWRCPGCDFEVVGGFAYNPVSRHFEPDFKTTIASYEKQGLLITNKG